MKKTRNGTAGETESVRASHSANAATRARDRRRLEKANRRRLRDLDPMRAGKILSHERYWTFSFLRLYLEACDERIFHEPQLGYQMAQHAPELARRIPVDPHPELDRRPFEYYATELEKTEWCVRALGVWGSGCRASGQLTAALGAYERALELCEAQPEIGPDTRGEILMRRAVLHIALGEAEAGVELASEAIELFREAENGQRVADSLVIRGAAFYLREDPRALDDATAALRQLESLGYHNPRSRRTYVSILQNMALALTVRGARPESLEQAAQLLGRIRTSLARRPLSNAKMRVFWVEGLLLQRMALPKIAKRLLLRARVGFEQLGNCYDFCMVTLDLAALSLLEDDREQARSLLEEIERQWSGVDPLISGWLGHDPGSLTIDQIDLMRSSLGIKISGQPRQPKS